MALDASHWQERATQAQMVADWLDDDEAKRLLLEVAERYGKIARIAEIRPIATSLSAPQV